MTTLEFAKENRDQVIENCPEGVSLSRFMNEFLGRFEATAKAYDSVCFPAFYEAIENTINTIRTDAQISSIKANNYLQDASFEASRKLSKNI